MCERNDLFNWIQATARLLRKRLAGMTAFGSFMTAISLTTLIATTAHADIYDVLRGTPGTPGSTNLTYSDLQGAATPEQLAAAQNAAAQVGINMPAQAPAPAAPAFKPTTLREEAFKELLNKTFPLLPEQIEELHRQYDREQMAINTSPSTPPTPISSTITVDLSPGAPPPIIRLATGFVTSIVFVDSTGQPWPVSDYSLGNPTGFNIKWDNKTNTLFMQNVKDHISGNMAVRLADLDTPITIFIVTGQSYVDYRVDLLVPGTGPNGEAPIVDNATPHAGASSALLGALDGVPPSGSIELSVPKEYGRAWIYNGKMLFRTKLTVLSPAWSASISSADGTKVYEMVQTPIVLASQNGKTIKIELTGM